MEKEEMKELAREHGVKLKTVRQFIEAGVPEEIIPDLLDMRNLLCGYDFEGDGSIVGQVSIEAMLEAFNAVEGDMDHLELLVEEATTRAGILYWQMRYRKASKREFASRFTIAMQEATEEFKDRGIRMFE